MKKFIKFIIIICVIGALGFGVYYLINNFVIKGDKIGDIKVDNTDFIPSDSSETSQIESFDKLIADIQSGNVIFTSTYTSKNERIVFIPDFGRVMMYTRAATTRVDYYGNTYSLGTFTELTVDTKTKKYLAFRVTDDNFQDDAISNYYDASFEKKEVAYSCTSYSELTALMPGFLRNYNEKTTTITYQDGVYTINDVITTDGKTYIDFGTYVASNDIYDSKIYLNNQTDIDNAKALYNSFTYVGYNSYGDIQLTYLDQRGAADSEPNRILRTYVESLTPTGQTFEIDEMIEDGYWLFMEEEYFSISGGFQIKSGDFEGSMPGYQYHLYFNDIDLAKSYNNGVMTYSATINQSNIVSIYDTMKEATVSNDVIQNFTLSLKLSVNKNEESYEFEMTSSYDLNADCKLHTEYEVLDKGYIDSYNNCFSSYCEANALVSNGVLPYLSNYYTFDLLEFEPVGGMYIAADFYRFINAN